MTQLAYETPPPDRPTRVRYGVLFFLCTLALLLYVDRVCIGQAASHIQRDLGITKTQMSWVFTVFSLAYALFEVPAGHWGDKYGSRGVITRVVVFWSVFTALTGAAVGLYSLLLVRFLFGAGEAGALPNVARVITRWFPVNTRGRVRGTVMLVSMTGAAIAPILSAHLIELVGWRWTFAIFGAAGVVWAIAFYLWFRDDPATHPQVNATELAFIGPPEHAPTAHVSIPWRTVLLSPNVWLLGLIMTVCGLLFYMLFQWFPTYLKEARGQGELASGWLTSIVMAAGAIGCLFGGWLSDFVLRTFNNRRLARSVSGAVMMGLAGGCALSVRYAESAAAITALNAAALFFMQSAVPTWWTVVAEISGRHGGAMWGLMNSMASLGLMGLNLLVGRLVDHRQSIGLAAAQAWRPVFDAVAVGLLLGAVAWLLVNATRSIVGPDAADGSAPAR
jgi:MFS transporter, ACS family, glucarate transporter